MTLQRDDPQAPVGPGAAPPRRRGSLVVGLLMLVVGAVLLSWTAWQFWGTTWVGHRNQQQVVSELEQQWETGQDQVRTEHGLAGAVVHVPRFGREYAVPVLEGVSDDVLSAGYGHFEGSALPGQVGNFALAAHRITHGEPLRRMPELRVGDEVVVETREMRYTYELTTGGAALTVPFTETWVVDPEPVNPDAGGVTAPVEPGAQLITLTTCAELFHTDDRSVAFGTLVDARPRT